MNGGEKSKFESGAIGDVFNVCRDDPSGDVRTDRVDSGTEVSFEFALKFFRRDVLRA